MLPTAPLPSPPPGPAHPQRCSHPPPAPPSPQLNARRGGGWTDRFSAPTQNGRAGGSGGGPNGGCRNALPKVTARLCPGGTQGGDLGGMGLGHEPRCKAAAGLGGAALTCGGGGAEYGGGGCCWPAASAVPLDIYNAGGAGHAGSGQRGGGALWGGGNAARPPAAPPQPPGTAPPQREEPADDGWSWEVLQPPTAHLSPAAGWGGSYGVPFPPTRTPKMHPAGTVQGNRLQRGLFLYKSIQNTVLSPPLPPRCDPTGTAPPRCHGRGGN